jgi:long-chain acyl-CoA synthetase
MERFDIPVRQLYGCTEAGALTLNTGYQVEQTWSSVGRPLPGVQCEILDPDEQGIGSIRIASPGLTKGYDGLPEAAENSFADGWFITGDRGRLDKDGYLYITGRRTLYIEIAGHKVDPYEIEDVLMRHPQIHEAAVVGINTAVGRSALKAVVVPTGTPSPSEEDLFRYCSEQLAMYKVPQIYEYRDALPRNPLGKVLKKYLIE